MLEITVFTDQNLDDEPVVVTQFEDSVLVLSRQEALTLASVLIEAADAIRSAPPALH